MYRSHRKLELMHCIRKGNVHKLVIGDTPLGQSLNLRKPPHCLHTETFLADVSSIKRSFQADGCISLCHSEMCTHCLRMFSGEMLWFHSLQEHCDVKVKRRAGMNWL